MVGGKDYDWDGANGRASGVRAKALFLDLHDGYKAINFIVII